MVELNHKEYDAFFNSSIGKNLLRLRDQIIKNRNFGIKTEYTSFYYSNKPKNLCYPGINQLFIRKNGDWLLNLCGKIVGSSSSRDVLELDKNRLIELNEFILLLIDKTQRDYDEKCGEIDVFKQTLDVVDSLYCR